MRVFTGEWTHETNTFSIVPTTVENFKKQQFLVNDEDLLSKRKDTRTPYGATYEAAEKYGWQLDTSISADSNPTGKIVDDTFEQICGLLVRKLEKNKYDGLLLHLHGAMVTESFQDAEGEILKRIRDIIGPEVPVVVTLDLHGNITEKMAQHASALIAVRTYPHIDFYEMAWKGADLLQRAMLGEVKLQTVIAKRPQLKGLDGGKTHLGSPMRDLIDRGESIEKEGGNVLIVSVCAGFTAADIYDIGPSVTVTVDISNDHLISSDHNTDSTDNTMNITALQRGISIANEFMDYAFETRHYLSAEHHTPESAVQHAEEYLERNIRLSKETGENLKPIVLAEITDNPGSGHYGDATDLLRTIINSSLSDVIFYAIFDANAVRQGVALGVGNSGSVTMGGQHDPVCGGGSLTVTGKVVSITDGTVPSYGPIMGGIWQTLGLSLLFRTNTNVDIVCISNNAQMLDIAQITSMGCDPTHKKVIVVKSNHHFRASLTEMSGEIITVDGGGLGSMILKGGKYVNVRRPIWPLDDI